MSGVDVHRPVFLSIDELESLAAHLLGGDLTSLEALRVKTRDAHRLLSFWEAFREEYLIPGRVPVRNNTPIEKRFRAISTASLQRFESGYYKA